jgi:hypothetical protein
VSPPASAPSHTLTAALPQPRPSEDQLRKEAMADPTVQALLEIFPVEKTKVEEI